jgi:hypothetical protein
MRNGQSQDHRCAFPRSREFAIARAAQVAASASRHLCVCRTLSSPHSIDASSLDEEEPREPCVKEWSRRASTAN